MRPEKEKNGRGKSPAAGKQRHHWSTQSQFLEAKTATMDTANPPAARPDTQKPSGDVCVRGNHFGTDIPVIYILTDTAAAFGVGVYPKQTYPSWTGASALSTELASSAKHCLGLYTTDRTSARSPVRLGPQTVGLPRGYP